MLREEGERRIKGVQINKNEGMNRKLKEEMPSTIIRVASFIPFFLSFIHLHSFHQEILLALPTYHVLKSATSHSLSCFLEQCFENLNQIMPSPI